MSPALAGGYLTTVPPWKSLVNYLDAHMKGKGREALQRNGTYKEEKSAEKKGQILVDRQTKEGIFA